MQGVWRVVGGDAVDGSVAKCREQGIAVLLFAEGRATLVLGSYGASAALTGSVRPATRVSVSVRWCGDTSAVTLAPRSLARRMKSTEPPEVTWMQW